MKTKPQKAVYSVSFEYKGTDGQWRWSYDHRCEAADEAAALRRWFGAGYSEIRNAKAVRL